MNEEAQNLEQENARLRKENQELRDSVRHLSSRHSELVNLLSRLEVAAVLLDAELKVERYTPQALEILELNSQDLGQDIATVNSRVSDADIAALCWQAKQNAEPVAREVRKRRDKTWLLRILPHVAGEHASTPGMAVVFIDITASKKREEELRLAYERLNQAQEVSFTGNFDRNLQTGEGFWSDMVFRLFGYQPGEADTYQQRFFEHVHPDDLPKVKQTIKNARESGAPYEVTFRYFTTSGEQRWGHSRGTVERDQHGTPLRLYGIFQDITRRKEAEETLRVERERLAMALEASSAGVYEATLPMEGTPYISPKWFKIHGVSKEDVPQQYGEFAQWYASRVDQGGLERMHAVLEEYRQGQRESHREVYQYRKPSGEWIWIQSVGRRIVDETGEARLVGAVVDVSIQKNAELELRGHRDHLQDLVRQGSKDLARSEALHRTVIEHFPDGSVVAFDHQLRYILAGGEALENAGLSEEDLVGKTVYEIFPEEFAGELERMFRKSLEGETVVSDLNYQDDIYDIHAVPVRDKDGEIVAGMALALRVTEKRQSERDRHEQAQLYRNLVANAPDIIARFDQECRLVFVNPAIQRYTRRPAREFVGHGVEIMELAPQERKKLADTLQSALSTGEEGIAQITTTFEGQDFTFHIRVAPERHVSGEVSSVLCIARDITGLFSLQRERERLLELIEATPDLVFTMDASGCLLYCNRGACDLLGLEMDKPKPEVHCEKIYPEEELRQLYEQFMPRSRQQGFWSGESRLLCREGKELPVKQTVISQQLEAEQGEVFSVIAHDLSRLKERELELEAAKDKAEAASRSKSEFLANMSHELRTPIAGILGMTSLLLKDTTLNTGRQKLEMISQAGSSLLEIINDILDLSKIEVKGIEIEEEPFSLQRMLDHLQAFFAHQAGQKGLAFSLRRDEAVPVRLVGDEQRLAQILRNLLSNALKFTERGSVSLHVQLAQERSTSVKLVFSVDDTGIGIPEDEQHRLFTSFTQLDSSYAKSHGGTGLGLAISNELVKLMGGSIEVRSAPGQGSSFNVFVCLDKALPENGRQQEEALAQNAVPQAPSLRVLAVEDNAINRLYIGELLDELGFQATLATGGAEALELLEEQEFDCVIMDVQMPGMDGLETTSRIRESGRSWSSIPIVAITAYAMKGDRERFLDSGMDEYLPKPVDGEQLSEVLGKVLHLELAPQAKAQNDARKMEAPQPQHTAFENAPDKELARMASEEQGWLKARMSKLKQGAELCHEFLRDIEAKKMEIQERHLEGDVAGLAATAHSLGGAAGVLGLQKLLRQARVVDSREFASWDEQKRDQNVELLLRQLEAARLAVLAELGQLED